MKNIKILFGFIQQNINFVLLSILIIIALATHTILHSRLESIGVIFSPIFTLLIYKIIEDYKIKWKSKYEAFKILYANRGHLINPINDCSVDEATINTFNSIDILFIDDKDVRECWKHLYDNLHQEHCDIDGRKARTSDLLTAMAISLGLENEIKYADIARTYYPIFLVNRNQTLAEKERKELEYYNNGSLFFKASTPPPNE